jgi:acetyl esterase/lipase
MPEVIRRGIEYSSGPGRPPTLLDLYLPDGVARPPLVVWIHGGAFVSGDRVALPPTLAPGSVFGALTAAGLGCASIDYRLAPAAHYPAPIADVRDALAFLRERAQRYGYDADRLGLWGESAGGLLALLAGLTVPGVRAIAAWYPITDILAMPGFADAESLAEVPEIALFGAPPTAVADLAVEASPITHVTARAPATLFVHGEADAEVPTAQSVRMHERMQRAGAASTLRVVADAGHCFDGHRDIPGLINETVGFLSRNLRAAEAG